MDKDNYTYQVEAYALFTHVDKSLLLLNPVVEKWGYTFRAIDLEEFEREFWDLAGLKKPYDARGMAKIEYLDLTVSTCFFEAIQHHAQFGINLLNNGYVIVLKKIEDYERIIINKHYQIDSIATVTTTSMHAFAQAVVHHLRLTTNCLADYLLQFHISHPQREIVVRYEGFCIKHFAIGSLNLTQPDVGQFAKQFSDSIQINPISEIAYDFFMVAHNIPDPRTEFVTLMTSLESIFTMPNRPIAHTISKHLASIVSSSQKESDAHYSKIKKLYDLRSALVHGRPIKGDLLAELQILKNYTRAALKFSLQYGGSKKDLFDYLNAKEYAD